MFSIGNELLSVIKEKLQREPALAMVGSNIQYSCASCTGTCKNSCSGTCKGSCQGGCTRSCKGHSR